MKYESQALRLAQMMEDRVTAYQSYELALPLVEVEHTKLKKLSVDDILLLGCDTLALLLIEDEHICAELEVNMIEKCSYLEIISIAKEPIESNHSKKYQTLKISLGKIQSRKLDIGYKIDITQRSLQDVILIVEGNIYASGCFTNVNEELAIKINKVEK